MSLKRALRKIDSLHTKIYQEIDRFENLEDRIEDCVDNCENLDLDKIRDVDYIVAASAHKAACDALRNISQAHAEIVSKMQEIAWALDDATDHINSMTA
ncbi:hypothetical protein [Caenibius sp. WL]|uniref:hypothetical protein n=1 Tax=Caenibius sp. WL TaxID=2872646 RepID=UPI001C99314B|nr:hypothetical protein [Caenibius sp. WL]QZP06823.1 hypothetical protein K5X80_08785 [Caenibius sp. WL]